MYHFIHNRPAKIIKEKYCLIFRSLECSFSYVINTAIFDYISFQAGKKIQFLRYFFVEYHFIIDKVIT